MVILKFNFNYKAQDVYARHSLSSSFREVTRAMDSVFNLNIDTADDGNFKMYQRWKYFWNIRVDNTNISNNYQAYLNQLKTYNGPGCK